MVGYFQCARCECLQTEEPYWLEEAYEGNGAADGRSGTANLNNLDTGAAQRNLTNLSAMLILAKLTKARNVLDYGGGDGLLCRLLRDHGLNAFVMDAHAAPTYAQGFTVPNFSEPDILSAFEVLEHFAHPSEEMGRLFDLKPRIVVATTGLYTGQGADWWYLIPETGHHIFFYSAKGMRILAEQHGYDYHDPGGFSVFVRRGTVGKTAMRLLYRALLPRPVRLHGALVSLAATPGVQRDFDAFRAAEAID
jgi:hypothetical protein